MGFRYAVIGSGRQGTAAAYDLARFGDAEVIVMADMALAQAEQAAERVNGLVGRAVARATQVDVQDVDAVVNVLKGNGVDVFISGVPYFFNMGLTRAALRAGASMCDFGGNTELVRQQLGFDAEAKAAGITLIPDCGVAPGLSTSLITYAMSLLDEARDIFMYDGGIPRYPVPPWNYILTFNIEGLTNEYFGTTLFLRDGKQLEMACFQEYEMVDFPAPIGQLEAFTTAGGTSTMPWTFEGRLRTLQNKTLRWPGHYAQWSAFNDAGLIGLEPVEVDGQRVIPRHLLHAVVEPQIRARPGDQDLVIVRIIARGLKNGQEAEAVVDLYDVYDASTGFTAMERTTGWHAAIMAGFMARGQTPRGGVPVELAVPGPLFIEEFRKRGFDLRVSYSKPLFLSTLPGRYYYDHALYELELERIFSRMWVCVGRADALPHVGAYRVITLGKESVVVVRNREGVLNAFLNVCRHRGARLCSAAEGQLKGSIQCRYHAWTYGLDGRLIGAPNVMSDQQFDRAAFGLLPVALEVWEGFIYLNLSDHPAPVAEQLHPVILERFGTYEPFARYGVGDLKVGKSITYDVQANWKLLLENFMECYHCSPMHPELCDLLPGFRSGKTYIGGEAASLAEGIEAFSMTGKASRPPLKGLRAEDARKYYGEVLLPNALINLLGDHVVTHTVWPLAPDRSLVVCDWLFDADVAAAPDFDPMDAVEIFDIVNKQDWEVCEMTQQSMASRAFKNGGVYVPNEQHIRVFADFVLEKLDG